MHLTPDNRLTLATSLRADFARSLTNGPDYVLPLRGGRCVAHISNELCGRLAVTVVDSDGRTIHRASGVPANYLADHLVQALLPY